VEHLLDTAPCGFLSLTDEGVVRYANATLLQLLGYERAALLEQHIGAILPAASRIFVQTHLLQLLRLHGRADELFLLLRASDGRDIPMLLNAVRRAEADGPVYDCALMAMFQRERYETELIQARKLARRALYERERAMAELRRLHSDLAARQEELEALNRRLDELASLDPLTGLKNRRVFEERLHSEVATALRYGEPLSLLIADIDFFKVINDTYSHLAGDTILRQVGQLLQQHLRSADLLARFGGEEFVLLLPRTDRTGAAQLGERLRAAVAAARPEGVAITISVGAATLSGARSGPDLLLAADQALYRSKARGRNSVTHADELPALDKAPAATLVRGEVGEA
jgi:diguanylate cyclase